MNYSGHGIKCEFFKVNYQYTTENMNISSEISVGIYILNIN